MKRLAVPMIAIWVFVCAASAAVPTKPAAVPDRYRDFKIYTTSKPDANDPAHIVASVEMLNEGKKPLKVSAKLEPNDKVGFKGAELKPVDLAPGAKNVWTLDFYPADGLVYEVLTGYITFGKVRERELFIAVQGPDHVTPKDGGAEPEALSAALASTSFTKDCIRITAKAEVVATYAPRIKIDWWRSDRTAGQDPGLRKKPLLTLAAAGQTKYQIAVGSVPAAADGKRMSFEEWTKQPSPSPSDQGLIQAVNDIQRCIRLMSEAALPITGDLGAPSPAIRLQLNDKRQWPHPDAYHLFTTPKGDVVVESGHKDGLRQGVYGLLTDYLDCHWFLPKELGEEIPRPADRTVVIGQIDDERKPSFFSMSGASWSNSPEWDRRNRCWINRGRMNFGHSWYGYVTPSEEAYKEHPDWWARDREGKIRKFDKSWSHTNFCTTNPEVIEMVAKKANAALSDPNALVTSLDPNDYAPMCLCDRCLALDKSYGVTVEDGTQVSDRLLRFSEEIYNRLDEKNKDRFLGILVYGFQMNVPKKMVPHKHHTGLICDMTWTYDHTRPFNDPTSPKNVEFYEILKGWGKILPQFGFYDYYGQFSYFGPWGIIHKMREDMPAFRDIGGTFLMIEAQPNFAINGLNLYTVGRLGWDVDADVDVLLEEFFTKFYGPAAGPMRNYWLAMEKYYALTRPGANAAERVGRNPALWTELDGYLLQAEELVKNADKRFQDRIAFHRDGFELGRKGHVFEAKYLRPEGVKVDYTGALEALDEGQKFLSDMQQKYSGGDYWPTLLASYFYPELVEHITKMRAKITGPKAGDATK